MFTTRQHPVLRIFRFKVSGDPPSIDATYRSDLRSALNDRETNPCLLTLLPPKRKAAAQRPSSLSFNSPVSRRARPESESQFSSLVLRGAQCTLKGSRKGHPFDPRGGGRAGNPRVAEGVTKVSHAAPQYMYRVTSQID